MLRASLELLVQVNVLQSRHTHTHTHTHSLMLQNNVRRFGVTVHAGTHIMRARPVHAECTEACAREREDAAVMHNTSLGIECVCSGEQAGVRVHMCLCLRSVCPDLL